MQNKIFAERILKKESLPKIAFLNFLQEGEIGLKVEVKLVMRLKDRPGFRLRTKNFRHAKKAGGILNIDYDEKSKTAEIEWKNKDIYQYLDVTKREWAEIVEYVNKYEGKGLTAHINSKFKDKHDYYLLLELTDPIYE